MLAPVLALLPPTDKHAGFEELKVDIGMLQPLKMPAWLPEVCSPNSTTASKLEGMFILFKWPTRLGGWALGTVASVNEDPTVKVGGELCNFKVHYPVDGDTAAHCLDTGAYAENMNSPSQSWVLLGAHVP